VETVAACITFAFSNKRVKGMMPLAKSVFHRVLPVVTSAASFAAYSIAVSTTGDASLATALHYSK